MEADAAAAAATRSELFVVNHRRDLVGFYERRGYAVVGEATWEEIAGAHSSGVLTRPSAFICMLKQLQPQSG